MKAAGKLTAIASEVSSLSRLAESAELPFVTGETALADLMQKTRTKDWILLTKDCAAPDYFHKLIETCVFNPGVVYSRQTNAGPVQFFNVRASSLAGGGGMFHIDTKYPTREKVEIKSENPEQYYLSNAKMFARRLYKRVNWLGRVLTRRPVPRGPFGALRGNKVVSSL